MRPHGAFDLAHASTVAIDIAGAEATLGRGELIEVDLSEVTHIDGSGAVQLARLIDRLEAAGHRTQIVEERHPEAAHLIALYRNRRTGAPPSRRPISALARLGSSVAELPGTVSSAFDFTGRSALTLPKALATPRSVDWRALPRQMQAVGADGLAVAAAANLLVGLIIGFLGVSQLGRFGATSYVPELVVVAQFRELGPLVTAIVVAGRSGAGLASEIATMRVSEEIDALESMGFDPMRWLVVPRCLALVIAVPVLVWIGDALALVGGLAATTVLTKMPPHEYVTATANAITVADFLAGLSKSPFLGLAIGLIACGQGLATQGGAAAVGTRTTRAVVLSIFAAIVISSFFTVLYAFIGV